MRVDDENRVDIVTVFCSVFKGLVVVDPETLPEPHQRVRPGCHIRVFIKAWKSEAGQGVRWTLKCREKLHLRKWRETAHDMVFEPLFWFTALKLVGKKTLPVRQLTCAYGIIRIISSDVTWEVDLPYGYSGPIINEQITMTCPILSRSISLLSGHYYAAIFCVTHQLFSVHRFCKHE